MASCDNTVLTGQEGLIQFKPLVRPTASTTIAHSSARGFICLAPPIMT